MKKFKQYEAVVFDPGWWEKFMTPKTEMLLKHPLKPGEVVYYLGLIPNVEGHCIVAKYSGEIVPMIHPEDLRKAKDEEL